MLEVKNLNEFYCIKLMEEADTKKVIRFINKNLNDKHEFEMSKRIFLSDQILNQECYNDINVRSSLYNFYEEYIALEKEGEIIALMSLDINRNNLSKVLNLNLVICEETEVSRLHDMVAFATEILPEYSIIEPTKIRTYIRENSLLTEYWKKNLKEAGFSHEVTRENEVDNGVSLTTMIIKMK